MENPRRIGVILAAGRGSRMGRTKQLIPWQTPDGTKPLVAAAYDTILPVCDEMIVVMGHDADAVAAALGKRQFHRVASNPDVPMFESIRAGLKAAQRIDPNSSVILQPGDQPSVAPATLNRLMESLAEPNRAIIPEYRGRGGHPILIPAHVTQVLVNAALPNGLNSFWTPDYCLRTVVDDPSILRDVDAPDDLRGGTSE